jgi:hypothetical protein
MDLGEAISSNAVFMPRSFRKISSLKEGGISGDQGIKASGRTKLAVFPAKKLSYKTAHFPLNGIFPVFTQFSCQHLSAFQECPSSVAESAAKPGFDQLTEDHIVRQHDCQQMTGPRGREIPRNENPFLNLFYSLGSGSSVTSPIPSALN